MKIGIVTIMDYTNYGNRLQNYAVYHILNKKLGYATETLASYKEKKYNDGNYISWIKEQIVKKLFMFPKYAEKRFGVETARVVNFCKWSKQIPTKNYYSCSMLPDSLNKEFDYFVAGSDQIWNYHFSSNKFNDYFLKFAEKEKRVAVSASFGVEEIPEEWEKEYKDGLNGFQHISVREDAGKVLTEQMTGRNVPVLIDPVMMLSKEEWLKVSKKPRIDISKPYVLKYYLGDKDEENKIDDWAEKNGYEVYELLNKDIPELYSAGPGEFISLIANAGLVCSDSFHCIVFSIIFSRPFIVYSRLGKANYMSSRLDTLLKKFGFEHRWKHLLTEEEYCVCDFNSVKDVLINEQKKFMDYLKNSLKK